jgi:hypothetical protein
VAQLTAISAAIVAGLPPNAERCPSACDEDLDESGELTG